MPVLVKDGGVITGYYTSSKPHTLTLGETENDVTTVLGYEYTGTTVSGYITVTDTLTINGKVYVGGRETSGGMLSLSAGNDINLLCAKAGELTKYGVEKFELHPELVARGCDAMLSIVTSKGYDYLRVTVTAAQDPNRCRWIAGTSGQWSVAENWDYAPLEYGNTIVFCRTGTKASITNWIGGYAKNATAYPYVNGLNGAVPNGAAFGIYAGTVAFDGDANTRYSVTNETWIGQYPIPDGTGGAYDACLEVRGGTLTLDGLVIGIHPKGGNMAGSTTDIGLTRSQKAIVNVKGGTLRIVQGKSGSFIMGYPRYTTSIISELNVSGGLLEVCGRSTSFGIGYHDSSNVVDAAELSATINIFGDGIFRKLSPGSFKFGKDRQSCAYLHNVALNMTGGRLESPENDLDLLFNSVKARVNLAGGVIDVLKIVQTKDEGTSGATVDFHFNGGTYRPNAAESTFPVKQMTSFTVGEGGAKFDLGESNLLTLSTQPLVTAAGVEQDGGITLDATGDAVLTLSVSNAFNGPIVVNGGKVVPAHGAVWLDLGLGADAPPPHGTRFLVAKVPEGKGFPAVRFRNPGWTRTTLSLTRVTRNGDAELWAEAVPRALAVIFR